MKILHVLPALTPGGAERVTLSLSRHAAADGHDVTLLVGWPSTGEALLRSQVDPRVKLEYVTTRDIGKARRYAAGLQWVVRNMDKLSTFDVLHCHLTFGSFIGTVVAVVRRRGKPAIVETYHAVGAHLPRWMHFAHRTAASTRDALVLMADHAAWRSYGKRNPRTITRVIANGADDPNIDSVSAVARLDYRRSMGIPDSCRFVVGTVGRLDADRQPLRHLALFAEIAKRMGEGVHFLFGGGGSEIERIHRETELLGLGGRVHITGVLSEPRRPLSVIDLYVTLNVGGTSGVAGIEAAIAGLPVIAIQHDPSYVGEDSDWIWSSADLPNIADRVTQLLRDPDARQALATRQMEHARRQHSSAGMWRSYEEVYRLAIAKRGA